MENLYIDGEGFIPEVNFNAEKGELSISGKSFHENTDAFYEPIINWLKEYNIQTYQPTTLNFKMTYFNTTSSKSFLQLLRILEDYKGEVTINWHYQKDDDDMLEDGENFATDTDMKFNFIEYP
ncbi:MAG: DUF1987 domain-containing protein [Bacteroidota bacterium]